MASTLLLLLLLVSFCCCCCFAMPCPAAGLFSFGDSLADTGNHFAAYPDPFDPGFHPSPALELPFRSCNGRLVIDFVAQAFGIPFLDPYFLDVDPNFKHGVNFAMSSSTARNTSMSVPFYLYRQVSQYSFFKKNVLKAKRSLHLPDARLFSTGMHWISIGINDIFQNYIFNNFTIAQVKSTVMPDAVHAVVQAIQRLYDIGARSFMVLNVPAVGCLPIFLSTFGTNTSTDYDTLGCLKNHNDVAATYASNLGSAMKSLRKQLSDVHIIYGDYYQVHLDVVSDPDKYGFEKTGTLTACCGGGGRFKPNVNCNSTTPVCARPNGYVTWDGLHFTEGFNRLAARTFLKGNLVEPRTDANLSYACKLDFSKFD